MCSLCTIFVTWMCYTSHKARIVCLLLSSGLSISFINWLSCFRIKNLTALSPSVHVGGRGCNVFYFVKNIVFDMLLFSYLWCVMLLLGNNCVWFFLNWFEDLEKLLWAQKSFSRFLRKFCHLSELSSKVHYIKEDHLWMNGEKDSAGQIHSSYYLEFRNSPITLVIKI